MVAAKKSKRQKLWNSKIFILAFQIAFAFCFFIGIFWHNPVRIEVSNNKSWYYINRGYPISWSGVSRTERLVNLPIVKAPFLVQELEGTEYVKIIDLTILLPFFLMMTAAAYYFLNSFFKDVINNKKSNRVFIISCLLLILMDYFFYFHWFPRI